ncbi:uncharacterized protein LOC134223867 isoform X1 [Armigeres subalbatus]|uniref:uncharacterized protein LOC134223867 isoform X1 n=1 Tax=Armigeres subalbatus TaxID=124917 RepID=UPI002ED2DC85
MQPQTLRFTAQHLQRMQTIPLSEEGETKELQHILETARINGYKERTIQAIINNKQRNLRKNELTTLTPIDEPLKRVSVPYDRHITHQLRHRLRKFGIDLVFSSRSNQMKTLLGSTKDRVEILNKAGVYQINCSQCDKVYVGQTKRSLDVRFKEHIAEVSKAKRETDKGLNYEFRSKVAEHVYQENHSITTSNIKILRNVSSPWKLNY